MAPKPKAWTCKQCGWQHQPAVWTCEWCAKPQQGQGRQPSRGRPQSRGRSQSRGEPAQARNARSGSRTYLQAATSAPDSDEDELCLDHDYGGAESRTAEAEEDDDIRSALLDRKRFSDASINLLKGFPQSATNKQALAKARAENVDLRHQLISLKAPSDQLEVLTAAMAARAAAREKFLTKFWEIDDQMKLLLGKRNKCEANALATLASENALAVQIQQIADQRETFVPSVGKSVAEVSAAIREAVALLHRSAEASGQSVANICAKARSKQCEELRSAGLAPETPRARSGAVSASTPLGASPSAFPVVIPTPMELSELSAKRKANNVQIASATVSETDVEDDGEERLAEADGYPSLTPDETFVRADFSGAAAHVHTGAGKKAKTDTSIGSAMEVFRGASPQDSGW